MNTLPKNYVILGHIKDINVPSSWDTPSGTNYKDHLTDWAWRIPDHGWNIVEGRDGWVKKSDDLFIAALIGSPLYNMNLPKKKARPTVKQVKELTSKIFDLETDKAFLEAENKKLREQLAAISKIISG